MNKFFRLTIFNVIVLLFLIRLMLYSYEGHFNNYTQVNNSESIVTINKNVLNQITNSFGDSAILVINIWESWCKPCINEIPELNKLSERYKGYNIRFIALSSSSREDCNEVLNIKNIVFNYESFFMKNSLIKHIDSIYFHDSTKSSVVPKHIVIDKQGRIVLFLEGANLENILKIKQYLNESIANPKN
jgi:thiol-disulfide isomerase/thioredoxin